MGGDCLSRIRVARNTEFYFTSKNRKIKRMLQEQLLHEKNYEPIIILGESASGKTTLANVLLQNYSGAQLEATKITCECLLSEVVSSIKANVSMDNLVRKYESYNLLVIDEIEDLSFKDST